MPESLRLVFRSSHAAGIPGWLVLGAALVATGCGPGQGDEGESDAETTVARVVGAMADSWADLLDPEALPGDSMLPCIRVDAPATEPSDSRGSTVLVDGARYRCETGADKDPVTVALEVESMDELSWVARLRVETRDGGTQVLDAHQGEAPPRGFDFLGTQDLDGDGIRELKLLGAWGATGNLYWIWWRYDPESERFAAAPDLRDMGNPVPLAGTRCARSRSNGGMAGQIFTTVVYCLEQDMFVPVRSERQDWSDSLQLFLREIHVRLPGADSLQWVRTDTVRNPAVR